MKIESENTNISRVLCVDLDGTLTYSDMLLESMMFAIRQNIFMLFIIPFYLLKGKENLKNKLAKKFEFEASTLPYNSEIIEYIQTRKAKGHKIVLATASNKKIADKIAMYFEFFDEILASDDKVNLKGKNKLAILNEKYGQKQYDYIGDNKADLIIFENANLAISTGNQSFQSEAIKVNANNLHFDKQDINFKSLIKALRVYQWVKNTLIFLPMLMAHKLSVDLFSDALAAFVSFSLMASGIYITNDLFDLNSDRKHIRKRFRPFASGRLSILNGMLLAPVLILLSFTIAVYLLPSSFLLIIFCYFCITSLYSFTLKKIAILDIIILAGLYTVRIIAGGFATGITISPWLLAFSMFIFASLAIMKRYTEVKNLTPQISKTVGRAYNASDAMFLLSSGMAAGFISILVFVLYLNSPQVTSLYHKPIILWGLLPVLLYWIMNIWFKANRGEMTDDPIVFTFTEKSTYLLAIISVLLIYLAQAL